MSRSPAVKVDNSFIGGLITDYTALNFPENACTDTINTIFDPSGRVERREGFEYEENFEFRNISRQGNVVTSFLWREVNGNGNTNLFVAQVGAILYFYETDANSISNGQIVTTVSLSTFATPNAVTLAEDPCRFAYGKGVLFVTHPYCEPFYVSYVANVLAATEITVEIRDFAGVDDSLDVTERPTANVAGLTEEHKYNLFNQGWYFNTNAALTAWDTARSDMPSNADVWWAYKNSSDAFDATTIANRDPGNTPAPKGHYILEAFNQDRSDASGIANIPVVTTNPSRPEVVAFFAGRIWYGGVDGDNLNKLYFSQVIEDPIQYGRCYQQNDPTSETAFDLLPTDGGTIEVSGAGTFYRLFPMGNSLLVFASNGIWAIAGSQGIGFVANDYSVVKISAVEQNSGNSFVSVDGSPYWLTGDAVCTVVSQDNLTFNVQKVSDQKIRNFLLDIPEVSKQNAVGSYNPFDRTIHWLYRTTDAVAVEDRTDYDRILVLNLLTGAFYVHTIPDYDVRVHSIELFKGFAGESAVVVVEVDGVPVTEDGDDVIIFQTQQNTSVPVFKYLISYYDEDLGIDRFTFAEMKEPGYLDWVTYGGGISYTSEFTTGYRLHTNGQRFFQANYIFVFLEERNTDSSCYMQGVFDYAESGNTGKWSSRQQIYNSTLLDRGVNYRRLKIRGKGRALQLRFTSEAQNPFTIIGWSIWETANNAL
jgi:hypothetical protein